MHALEGGRFPKLHAEPLDVGALHDELEEIVKYVPENVPGGDAGHRDNFRARNIAQTLIWSPKKLSKSLSWSKKIGFLHAARLDVSEIVK